MGLLDDDRVNLRESALCPYDKQPCIKERCNSWITYARADGKTFVGCAEVFTPVLLGELIVEMQRNQASADKVATEVHHGFGSLIAVADGARRRALKSR